MWARQLRRLTTALVVAYLWEIAVLRLFARSQLPHLVDARPQSTLRLDLLLDAIQPQPFSSERSISPSGRYRAQMVLVQSDGERVIGGKDELGVSLAPVLAVSRPSKRSLSASNRFHRTSVSAHLDDCDVDGRRTCSLVLLRHAVRVYVGIGDRCQGGSRSMLLLLLLRVFLRRCSRSRLLLLLVERRALFHESAFQATPSQFLFCPSHRPLCSRRLVQRCFEILRDLLRHVCITSGTGSSLGPDPIRRQIPHRMLPQNPRLPYHHTVHCVLVSE